ncbi:HI0074 family nucleotidyltransferase substrate-binding subunit [Dongshaea marina]|uniref:HI0074 family nucleotidyltransferase substrate-binding subunit n=1 Tax=Dongshaea marina TaxID=2047966 RepID=UPI000D3E89F9|nr:HI0074 family nucleotidyltransferase substrate-binding subunit [Dongshaea marina]
MKLTLNQANASDSFTSLGLTLERLKEALQRSPEKDSLVLDATIQRFEFCIELTWKVLKKILEAEGEQVATPRQALSAAYQAGWFDDEALWLGMLKDRNLTSHTYREELALEIYQKIASYHQAMAALYSFLQQQYQ